MTQAQSTADSGTAVLSAAGGVVRTADSADSTWQIQRGEEGGHRTQWTSDAVDIGRSGQRTSGTEKQKRDGPQRPEGTARGQRTIRASSLGHHKVIRGSLLGHYKVIRGPSYGHQRHTDKTYGSGVYFSTLAGSCFGLFLWYLLDCFDVADEP